MRYLGPETEILHERYARAIFGIAEDSKKLDEVAENLSCMNELTNENEALYRVLENPEVDKIEKLKVLGCISEKARFSEEFNAFLKLLVEKDRFSLIHGIFLRYRDLYDKKKKRLKVFIKTAQPLKKTRIEKLEGALSKTFKKDVKIAEILTPSLLGGLDIEIKDLVYNTSLAGRLEDIKERLIGI